MKNILAFHFVLLFFSGFACERDTLLPLREVEIAAEKISLFPAYEIDSVWAAHHISGTLADNLLYASVAEISTYGPPGTVAQLRIRGNSADHTGIFWNNSSLNSLSLGTTDLSLIPVFFFTGRPSFRHRNAIGGAFDLNAKNECEGIGAVHSEYNTLGNYWIGGSMNLNRSRFSSVTKVFYNEFENDFTYTDVYRIDKPAINQKHNDGFGGGVLQKSEWSFARNSKLEGQVWYQLRKMQLPALMGSTETGEAEQEDAFFRSSIALHHQSKAGSFSLLMNWLYDTQNYFDIRDSDGAWLISTNIRSRQLVPGAEGSITIYKWLKSTAGAQMNFAVVHNNNYNGTIAENYFSPYFSIHISQGKKGFATITAREEFRSGHTLFSGSCREEYTLLDRSRIRLDVTAEAGLASRMPDFNERFWQPGGNPLLEPERSRRISGGLNTLCSSDKIEFNYTMVYFHSWVKNWIQWMPGPEGYWSPQNFKEVRSHGVEHSLSAGNTHVGIKMIHSWLIASGNNSTSWTKDEEFIMPYSPKHRINISLRGRIKNMGLLASYIWSSERHTSELNDPRLALPPSGLFNFSCNYELRISTHACNVTVGVDNILNQHIETIRSYALPGRVGRVALSFHLFKTVKNIKP